MMDVHDDAAYAAYREQVPAFISKHGGRFIVRAGTSEVVEGTWPAGRIIVLEFPDYAAAQAFVADPDYQPVAAIRHDTADSHLWLVDGVPDGRTADGMHGFILGRVRIDDADSYKTYADQVPGVITELGGTYLARGGECEAAEGGMLIRRALAAYRRLEPSGGRFQMSMLLLLGMLTLVSLLFSSWMGSGQGASLGIDAVLSSHRYRLVFNVTRGTMTPRQK